MTSQPTFEEIKDFFNRYKATFERLEPRAIAGFWFAPTLSLEPDAIRICVDDKTVRTAFDKATRELRAVGMSTTYFSLEEVRILRNDLVDCLVRWRLSGADGATLKTLNNIYVLRRGKNDWGVAAVYLLLSDQPLAKLTESADKA